MAAPVKPTSPSPDIPGKNAQYWQKQIESALSARREHEPWWEANDKAYAPIATVSPDTYGGDINTNRDYTLVERKKSDLFNRRPDVSLIPTPLMDGPILAVIPDMGTSVLVQSFVVIVIGGVGSFGGAIVGGIIAGEIVSLTSVFAPDWAQVALYLAMALVLIVRPQGLLGVVGRA